ncbi:MAG: hypothetical protein B6D37_04315 [Sphingobacteriales bacterium UTBCD1]|jgi:2'-5' RNA ligase|nr:MAG: hypothetical protein B6D37_04315 [Sphingobacteriales bacterium UTBCD1]
MKAIVNTIPGYRVYEYLLVLSPHEELWNKVMEIKKRFAHEYKWEQAVRGRPYLALVNFMQYEMMEKRIAGRLKTIAMGQYPFKTELKNFGSFPSHTIYVSVATKLPIQALVKGIRRDAQRLMKLSDHNKPHFILEPHLTIARKLKPSQYEKAWLEYRHKNFTGRFIASGMTLLKRPAGIPGDQRIKYYPVERFEFQNLPVLTRQGELFG